VCQKHCKYIKIEEFGGQKDLKKKKNHILIHHEFKGLGLCSLLKSSGQVLKCQYIYTSLTASYQHPSTVSALRLSKVDLYQYLQVLLMLVRLYQDTLDRFRGVQTLLSLAVLTQV